MTISNNLQNINDVEEDQELRRVKLIAQVDHGGLRNSPMVPSKACITLALISLSLGFVLGLTAARPLLELIIGGK